MRNWGLIAMVLTAMLSGSTYAEERPRTDWGAAQVNVSNDKGIWTIAGQKNKVVFRQSDFFTGVDAGGNVWSMLPSKAGDLLVNYHGGMVALRLADARKISVEPYDTGYKTGIKITLGNWRSGDSIFDLTMYLTLCLEGANEELVFDVAADERDTFVHELNWPGAVDGHDVDYTLLPANRGVLLPRDWPKEYLPMRGQKADGSQSHPDEKTEPQSNVIEDWSMSWWGWVKGKSADGKSAAAMVMVETPDDAAYQFSHPAGGPTTIGPRWRESLGKLGYVRGGRMIFFPQGNYVTLAKRYRKYAIDSGLFVPLTEKIARRPIVKEMIGTPFSRMGILTNIKKDSLRFSTTQPEFNHHVTTFDEVEGRLKKLKSSGLDRFMVVLTSWPKEGYDRQHPDVLPPAPEGGGYEGMARLAQTCKDLGYLFTLHDQYRDYYTDAPSYNVQFAVHEEDDNPLSTQFPGSRFGQWKKGRVAYMNNWDGGEMAYLNPRFMLGNVIKNYDGLFAHGIHPQGSYQDVFGYVPPDEDFNPEHPTTRTQGRLARAAVMNWCRANLGIVGTEAGCDWVVPYADYVTPPKQEKGIVVPLYNLVYHDAVMSPAAVDDLRGWLNGCFPQIGGREQGLTAPTPELKRMMALHKRVALLEMTNHEFLDDPFRVERTTFADGTTVTVDWGKKSVEISPKVEE